MTGGGVDTKSSVQCKQLETAGHVTSIKNKGPGPPSGSKECQSWQLLARPGRADVEVFSRLRMSHDIHNCEPPVLVRISESRIG